MISVYKSMTAEPEGDAFAVFTTAPSGARFRLGAFRTERLAQKFIASRTKGSRNCPVHNWTFINPHAPTTCPGLFNTDQPWIQQTHEVAA